ncbi:MAG TPA: DUF2520 domain-containing protein [Gemmatimonadaceae bacterium]|nr:DUF2520 domain-containing protein [Gemmatimonadaceae bacterium]
MTNTPSVALARVTIVGPGRVGRALAEALGNHGVGVRGPLGHGFRLSNLTSDDVVLLCVPDDEIARVAADISHGPLVGHCAGALTLDVLSPHEGFSMHPLLAITGEGTRFDGAAAAIAGTSSRALGVAREMATRLGMLPIEIADADRTLYHSAAVIASNYLVVLEEAAASVGARVGLERRHLARLAESALVNWTRDGARSLTGPVARGDEAVIARQRAALAASEASLLPLWDALTERARAVAAEVRD